MQFFNKNSKISIFYDILAKSSLKSKINLFKNIKDYYLEPTIISFSPIFLQIEPTTFCNLKCKFCHNVDLKNKTYISFEKFKYIISQFPYVKKINLVGLGEPLMNPDLIDIIAFLNQQNIKVGFATNTMLLDEKISKRLIDAGLSWIYFSIDSADPQSFETLRIGANLKQIINNIKNFIKLNNNVVETGIATVIGKHNIDSFSNIIDLTHSLGINKIFTQTIHFWGREDYKNKFFNYSLQKEPFIQKLKKIAQYARSKNIRLIFENIPDKTKSRGCKWPWKSLYITVDGYITPCCMHGADPNIINFGNIFEQNINNILNSEDYQNFRKQLKSHTPPQICKNCTSYYKTLKI